MSPFLFALVSVAHAGTPTCEALPDSLPEGIENAQAAVVVVPGDEGFGSGLLLSKDGLVLTAAHVVGDRQVVTVRTKMGLELEAPVARVDHGTDLALLDLPGAGYPCLRLATGRASTGDDLYIIGAPASEELAYSVSKGVVSGFPIIEGVEYLQTDASVNPGNSGGPVLGPDGTVIGVVKSKLTGRDYEGLGFAVPADIALTWLESAIEHDVTEAPSRAMSSKEKEEEFLSRAVWFQDYVGISSATGAVVSSWSEPRRGIQGAPLAGADFYDYVGRADLAEHYRSQAKKAGIFGYTGLALGLIGGGLGMFYGIRASTDCSTMGTATYPEAETGEEARAICRDEAQSAKLPRNVGIGVATLGGVSLVFTTRFSVHKLEPHERRQLAINYNRQLADELGLELE